MDDSQQFEAIMTYKEQNDLVTLIAQLSKNKNIFGVTGKADDDQDKKSLSDYEAQFFSTLESFAQMIEELQFDQKPHY